MKIQVLIISCCRPDYLRYHLKSLLKQDSVEYDVLVINDGIEDSTEEVAKEFHVDYLFTGQRNSEELKWRIPGYATNIGVRLSSADIVVLTCAEMYHLNDSLRCVVDPVISNAYAIGTPHVYDDHNLLLRCLRMGDPKPSVVEQIKQQTRERYKKQDPFLANGFMPYFMAIRRERLIDIGGYDEDFIGIGADDNDLMERLILSGCHYCLTNGEVVHLYHKKPNQKELKSNERYLHNVKLWKDRRGQIVRNIGRDWGKL